MAIGGMKKTPKCRQNGEAKNMLFIAARAFCSGKKTSVKVVVVEFFVCIPYDSELFVKAPLGNGIDFSLFFLLLSLLLCGKVGFLHHTV